MVEKILNRNQEKKTGFVDKARSKRIINEILVDRKPIFDALDD